MINNRKSKIRNKKRQEVKDVRSLVDTTTFNMEKTEIPYENWVKELAELDAFDFGGALRRLEWIEGKLKRMNLNYVTPRTSSLGTIKAVNFVDEVEEPVTLFVVPVGQRKEDGGVLDYSAGIVQMLLMAEQLKNLNQFVNVQLAFVSPEENHLFEDLLREYVLRRFYPGLISSIVVPAYITGKIPISVSAYVNDASTICKNVRGMNKWAESFDIIYETMEVEYDELTNYHDNEIFDISFIGFGSVGSTHEFGEIEHIRDRQFEFSASEKFLDVNQQLCRIALIKSRIDKEFELNKGYFH